MANAKRWVFDNDVTMVLSMEEAKNLFRYLAMHSTTSHFDTYPVYEALYSVLIQDVPPAEQLRLRAMLNDEGLVQVYEEKS